MSLTFSLLSSGCVPVFRLPLFLPFLRFLFTFRGVRTYCALPFPFFTVCCLCLPAPPLALHNSLVFYLPSCCSLSPCMGVELYHSAAIRVCICLCTIVSLLSLFLMSLHVTPVYTLSLRTGLIRVADPYVIVCPYRVFFFRLSCFFLCFLSSDTGTFPSHCLPPFSLFLLRFSRRCPIPYWVQSLCFSPVNLLFLYAVSLPPIFDIDSLLVCVSVCIRCQKV